MNLAPRLRLSLGLACALCQDVSTQEQRDEWKVEAALFGVAAHGACPRCLRPLTPEEQADLGLALGAILHLLALLA